MGQLQREREREKTTKSKALEHAVRSQYGAFCLVSINVHCKSLHQANS